MRKRDRMLPLLPRAFRTTPATATTQQTSSTANPLSEPPSVQSASSTSAPRVAVSTTTASSSNPALELALQRFFQQIPEAEKDAFRDASKTIDEGNLLSRARACDETHKQSSSFRPQAERISKFLNFLNRFVGGVAIGIQAYPEISSLVVGAVRIVIDLAIGFTTFFSRLSGMLCQFEDYLEPLAEYAKAPEHQSLVQETVANVYGDLLDFCRRARLVFVDANGNARKVTSLRVFLRQQWDPFETTFERISTDMQHRLDVLLHATQASQLTFLRKSAQDTEKREKANQRTSFLDWISKMDFEESHDQIFAKKHQATGDWLIQRQDFQAWYGGSSSTLLWCYGKPGIGKSVLAANVLEYITRRCALNKESALCRKRDSIPDWLLRFKKDSLNPSTASKEESFISLAESFQEIFLVIDALDECPKSKRSTVIGFITKPISSLPCAKVFITSRRESDIVRAFESRETIQIRADNVAADIERFVCSEVDKLRQGYHGKKLHLNSNMCERRVIKTLTEKADGMFLWVNLQLESLCHVSEARKDQLVEAALDDLPRGLDETYARIVERIDGQQEYMRDLALNCFSWVFYAQRPLSKRELQHALATKEGSRNPADLDLDEIDVILEACGNLLIEEGSVIQPIHFSVHEFFVNPPCGVSQGSVLGKFAEPRPVHARLARVCLQYIQFGVPKQPEAIAIGLWCHLYKNPLAQYAAQCFDSHVLSCEASAKDIQDLIEELLRQDGPFLAAILQIRNLQGDLWPGKDSVDFHPASFPVSPITIVYGTQLYDISYLRARWARHNLPRYVLHSASSVGLFSVVERLLIQGCDVNEMNDQGIRPIHFACRGGHFSVVELLIREGGDVNTQGDGFGSVLQAASIGGCNGIVELLIRIGVNVNAQGGFHGNALQAASAQGHKDTVKLLIEEGADVCLYGGHFDNALQAASAGGHNDIIKLLISSGANINAQGGYFGNALQAASMGGHTSVVELLISRGADVHGQGGTKYGLNTALQAALAGGHDGTVELFISKGVDVNMQGPYGNALQVASYEGQYYAVELLIHKGADITANTGGYGSALQAASMKGFKSIVRLLIDRGADINAQGGEGRYDTALQAASGEGYNSIVKLLLDRGANINAQGGHYGNALQAALAQGHKKTAKLLKSRGAETKT